MRRPFARWWRAPARLILASVAFTLLAPPAPAGAQLPGGQGQAETIKVCGTCHPPERGASVRLTREGWEDLITKMVSMGAKGSDAELAAVLEYLSTHFKGEGAVPLNLNRATSVELESVAGFLRKESAAWIAHRAKHPCTTVDDLRTVAGLDFRKIERRRERLVCF